MQIVLLEVFCWNRIFQKCKLLLFCDNKFCFRKNENTFTANECQLNEGVVFPLMILNVNTLANVILQQSLHANEGHIGDNETIMKQIWTWIDIFCKWTAKGVFLWDTYFQQYHYFSHLLCYNSYFQLLIWKLCFPSLRISS